MIDQTPKVPKALKTPQAPTVKPDPAAAPEPDAGTGGALGPDAGESRPNRRLPGRRDPVEPRRTIARAVRIVVSDLQCPRGSRRRGPGEDHPRAGL